MTDTDKRQEYARLFVELIVPRMMETVTSGIEENLETMKLTLLSSKRPTSKLKKAIKDEEDKLKLILSGEPAQKLTDFYVDKFAEKFDEGQLLAAYQTELFSVGATEIALQSDAFLKEVLGEKKS